MWPYYDVIMESCSLLLALCEGKPSASDPELWCFILCVPEQTGYAIVLIVTSLQWIFSKICLYKPHSSLVMDRQQVSFITSKLDYVQCGHMCNPIPDRKVHGASMGPIWDRQDPGGPHVGPINFALWDVILDRAITVPACIRSHFAGHYHFHMGICN